jgi:hypothetical protein
MKDQIKLTDEQESQLHDDIGSALGRVAKKLNQRYEDICDVLINHPVELTVDKAEVISMIKQALTEVSRKGQTSYEMVASIARDGIDTIKDFYGPNKEGGPVRLGS